MRMNSRVMSFITAVLLCSSSVGFAQNSSAPSDAILALQKQARTDFEQFKQIYQTDYDRVLPTVLAFGPFVIKRRASIQALEEQVTTLRKQVADIQATAQRTYMNAMGNKNLTIRQLTSDLKARQALDAKLQRMQAQLTELVEAGKLQKEELPDLLQYMTSLKNKSTRSAQLNAFYEKILFEKSPKQIEQAVSDFFLAVEDGNSKRAINILRKTYEVGFRDADYELIEKLIAQKQKTGYSAQFTKQLMRELAEAYSKSHWVPRKQALQAIGKKLLSKTNIGAGVVLAALLVGTQLHAQTADDSLAKRLNSNMKLFLDATPDELALIEQNPAAAKACQENSQTLRDWVSLEGQSDGQQNLLKQEVKKSLAQQPLFPSVRAY